METDGGTIMVSEGRLTISGKDAIKSVTLYNIAGQALTSYTPNAKVARIVLAGYPDGVYLVRVKTTNKEVTRKIVKK